MRRLHNVWFRNIEEQNDQNYFAKVK
jgi:hypothetical protein